MNQAVHSSEQSLSASSGAGRTNDPARTMAEILTVATHEFADKGLSGARIDEIAAATRTSKRMIYYYFGSKDGLYLAVLEEAYRRMRAIESDLHLDDLPPVQALQRLVEFTYDHHRDNEDFIRLVMNENIQRGDYLRQSQSIQQLNTTMQSMAAQFNSLQVMQGTALIGRNVMTEGSSLAVADKAGKGGFEIPSAATNVKIEVTTAGGQVVDTIDLGAKAAGRHTFEWDASKYTGTTDALQFRVTAVNGSTKLSSTPLALSKVTAAGAEDGQLKLTLANGKTINYSQIKALV